MGMATRGVLPSTLLRALQRFAVDADNEDGPSISHGLLLGAAGHGDADAVAIYGVLRDLSASEAVLPHVVRGVAPVGSFTVWIRGAKDDDETAERDAAAVVGKEALRAASSALFAPRVALVYVHDTRRVHLFSGDAAMTPLALEIVECAHASDFVAATESLLLRASLSFRVDSVGEIAAWRAQLERGGDDLVFFQFPEQRDRLFNARGERVDLAGVKGADAEPLSALVKIPEKRVAISTSKAKKKKATALLDNWDATPSKKNGKGSGNTSSGDFLTANGEDTSRDGGYLKTLEYGDIANVEVLHSLSFAASAAKGSSPAPTLLVSSGQPSFSPVQVQVDALVLVPQSALVSDAVAALRAELAKQLSLLEAEYAPTTKTLRTHHFALAGAAFPLSLPAVDGARPSTAAPSSHTLATQLLQTTTQPLFVPKSCSLVDNALALADLDVLFNVHEGIPASGVPNGTQYLVDGFYGYYHYMQQSMNDKGWGCAYRSLQTLASWLFLNHYTATPTVSHRKIQQTLVDIGDKPAAFVGSREWIGSMEVGFVLDELFGVSFRTLNVANGAQLVEKAQELKHHFETQGTPVMMGGGQLAFTLLGIDYNASSGECAFLILDPHYVGTEDLETIQTKTMALEGYKAVPCGWRKASAFSKTSFYNLCLPQRPDTMD